MKILNSHFFLYTMVSAPKVLNVTMSFFGQMQWQNGHLGPVMSCKQIRGIFKVSKGAKIRSRYNQVPHPTQDTNGKVTNSQLDTTNESQEVSPFPAGGHKAQINRRAQRHSKHKTNRTPSLPSISARNMPGEIRLFWFYYGVAYNFIQNHNHCRDLHQIFSSLFETFGKMSEIMFSSDSMSKKYFFNSWKYMNVYFRLQHHCFGMVGKQWFKNVRMTGISSIADSN